MQQESDRHKEAVINDKPFVSTRHRDAEPDTFDPSVPRLGRRESEPHAAEISYLYDVLTTNFPEDRTIWDLHHYFTKKNIDIDIQFDISYFKGLKIPYTLSSYKVGEFNNKVPTMAINILSKSTWRSDIGEKVDLCHLLSVSLYVVFPSYNVATELYKPPFLRAYVLKQDGTYEVREIRKVINEIEGVLDMDAIIDVSDIVPFRLGLWRRAIKHQKEESLYRLVLINPKEKEILLTENEKNEQLLNEQAQKINEQAQKINEQAQKINEQSQKINEQSQKIDQMKSENLKLKKLLEQK